MPFLEPGASPQHHHKRSVHFWESSSPEPPPRVCGCGEKRRERDVWVWMWMRSWSVCPDNIDPGSWSSLWAGERLRVDCLAKGGEGLEKVKFFNFFHGHALFFLFSVGGSYIFRPLSPFHSTSSQTPSPNFLMNLYCTLEYCSLRGMQCVWLTFRWTTPIPLSSSTSTFAECSTQALRTQDNGQSSQEYLYSLLVSSFSTIGHYSCPTWVF